MAWIWSDPRDAGSSLHPLWVRCSGSQGVTLDTAWSLEIPSWGILVLYKGWFWCDGISVTLSDEGRCEMCEGEINAAFVTGERSMSTSWVPQLPSPAVSWCQGALPGQGSLCVCAWEGELIAESLDPLHLLVLVISFRGQICVTGYCGCKETFSSLIMVGIITRCFETTVVWFLSWVFLGI